MIHLNDAMTVRSAQGDYTVERYAEIAELFAKLARIENAFIVADDRVVELYTSEFRQLDGVAQHYMPALESEKTLDGVQHALLTLQAKNGNKRTTVIGIGGGIVQDVSTLVAHLWYRGVDFVYVPTTLLAMADSCIGAKTAVNLGSFKNQIGTFQSPKRVLTCHRFISTLSDEAVRSGYGEIVKLAMVESLDAFERVAGEIDRDGVRGPAVAEHITMSLQIKRRVIEIDEYEAGLRKTLNFGHTFGHALESVVTNEVPHGLAVAWGVDVAGYVALRLGLFEPAAYDRVHAFLVRTFGFTLDREITAGALAAAMRRDKKAIAGTVSLILPRAIGEVDIVPTVIDADLEAILADYLGTQGFLTHR